MDLTAIIAATLLFISQNTQYVDAARAPHPRIEFWDQAVMNAHCNAGHCMQRGEGTFRGLYNCELRRIALPKTWDANDVVNRGTLAHELTRHMQCLTGDRDDYCQQTKEAWDTNVLFVYTHIRPDRSGLAVEYRKRADIAIKHACS